MMMSLSSLIGGDPRRRSLVSIDSGKQPIKIAQQHFHTNQVMRHILSFNQTMC